MAGKLKMLVGFGAGYVIGARAGRERYDQIAAKAQEWWRDPRIQEKAEQAQQVAKQKTGQVQQVVKEKIGEKVGDVNSKVNGRAGRAGGNDPSASGTASAGVSGTGTDGGQS
jgi:gas vesicle protein